jgi:hypothetical protein
MYAEYKQPIKGTEAEELYKTYNILLSDLVIDDTKEHSFDGEYYYIHTKTEKKYCYNSFENNWYLL